MVAFTDKRKALFKEMRELKEELICQWSYDR
jgi:hypothetical protein